MMAPVILVDSTDEMLHFEVRSSSRPDEVHDVYFDVDHGMVCTCEQYYYRKKPCKHMTQVKEYMNTMNSLLQKAVTFEEVKNELNLKV